MPSAEAEGIVLDLGFADESFTVYDHPMTLVFENRGRHTAEAIEQALAPALTDATRVPGLMLTAEEAEAQRAGGTWSEIVRPASWSARLPVLSWLLVVELMSLLAVPIAFVLLRRLPDRGYLLAKPLGLLLVSLVVWLLASYGLLAFSLTSIGAALAAISAVSLPLLAIHRREIGAFVARRWKTLLAGEAVFLVAFLAFVLVRMANPDLWHSHLGGEKPMDMAYLNAVLKSSYMPPYDPWFGGGYINYYYWGQFMVATLVRSTGIDPAVAFNLAVPLFFALTAGAAYSIVYNLASAPVIPAKAGIQRGGEAGAAQPRTYPDRRRRSYERRPWRSRHSRGHNRCSRGGGNPSSAADVQPNRRSHGGGNPSSAADVQPNRHSRGGGNPSPAADIQPNRHSRGGGNPSPAADVQPSCHSRGGGNPSPAADVQPSCRSREGGNPSPATDVDPRGWVAAGLIPSCDLTRPW